MSNKRRASGIYHELFLNEKSCGYAVSLNSADQLKKYSHLFSDVSRMLFDEFQSETNHYCSDEIKKLLSIHTSVARGQGEQIRYVPVYKNPPKPFLEAKDITASSLLFSSLEIVFIVKSPHTS